MDTLWNDIHLAVRQLVKNPLFTVVAVGSLGLGIGASAAIFGVFDAVVLDPVSGVPAADRIVEDPDDSFSYPEYLDFRDRAGAFDGLAAYSFRTLRTEGDSGTELVDAGVVSGNFFEMLGVGAASGRPLASADDRPGAPLQAMLSHAAWRERYGGDPAVVGRTVRLNGREFTVIGVAPREFRSLKLGTAPEFWVPIEAWAAVKSGEYVTLDIRSRGWSWLRLVGRLAPEATAAVAEDELTGVWRWQLENFPRYTSEEPTVDLAPVAATAAGFANAAEVNRFVGLLMVAVVLALAIACANVANLMLARAERRRHEIGVRLALGAGRGRILRQLMTESALIAAASVGVGVLVAAWGIQVLRGIELPGGIAVDTVGLAFDGRILAFAAALAAVTALAFGLVPALRTSSTRATAALQRLSATQGPRSALLRAGFVTVQVALCLALLAGAGLFLLSLRQAMAVDLGFDAQRLGAVRVALDGYGREPALTFVREVEERIEASPAVASAAWALQAPLDPGGNEETFEVAGYSAGPNEQLVTGVNIVGPGYFATTGTPLVSGRDITEPESFGGSPAVVVNQVFADRYLPAGEPVGATMMMSGISMRIVGVARNVVHHEVGEEPRPFVYASPLGEVASRGLTLILRASGDDVPAALRAATGEVRALDPDLPLATQSTAERLRTILMPQRVAATLFGLFSVLTVVLAATGIYGVVAYTVSARTTEFGIRMALGARPAAIVRFAAVRGLAPVGAGLALGVGIVLGGGRALSGLLFGVEPADPVALTSAATLFAAVALVASAVPALRAGRVDPATVLRQE